MNYVYYNYRENNMFLKKALTLKVKTQTSLRRVDILLIHVWSCVVMCNHVWLCVVMCGHV